MGAWNENKKYSYGTTVAFIRQTAQRRSSSDKLQQLKQTTRLTAKSVLLDG